VDLSAFVAKKANVYASIKSQKGSKPRFVAHEIGLLENKRTPLKALLIFHS
jgi:hypothetical protein